MAGKIGKTGKRILSVLFHLAVLVGMVVLYDAGNLLVKKYRGEKDAEKEEQKKEQADSNKSEGFDFAAGKMPSKADPDLEQAVAKNADGYLFRNDTPLPPHLKVTVRESRKVGGKGISKDVSVTTEYESVGKVMRITLRDLSGSREAVSDLKGKPVDFKLVGNAWKAVSSKDAAVSKEGAKLEPEIHAIRSENGLVPRQSWIGNGRVKPGRKFELKGASLDIVLAGARSGTVQFSFIGPETVGGHPCGAFAISGNVVRDRREGGASRTTTESLKIESGKVLLSMLYPVVMGSDLNGDLTLETREGDKLVSSNQGSVALQTRRDWKAVISKPKGN
ncbi:MAG: hypothetical protein ABJQ29_07550 [Luteolibacter sp.]